LELKEEKVSALNRELEELTFGGNTEEEIAQLKRSKLEFEKRCKEQEEELDEMAGQIQVNLSFKNNELLNFKFKILKINKIFFFEFLKTVKNLNYFSFSNKLNFVLR
jgi:hypothetical protein